MKTTPITKSIIILWVIAIGSASIAQTPSQSQESKYRFSIDIGTTISFGGIEKEREEIFSEGKLTSRPKWSGSWPVSSKKTGISFLGNLTRKFSFSFYVERILNKNFSLASGIEVGGRHFMITEFFHQNPSLSIVSKRGYQVFSIPLLVKHDTRITKSFYLRKTAGVIANLSNSVVESGYYSVNNKHTFFPTIAFGVETVYKNANGFLFAFELMWQQGLYNILDDIITPVSQYYPFDQSTPTNVTSESYKITSNGSNLKIGLKFYFNSRTSKRNNPASEPELIKIDTVKELSEREVNNVEEIEVDTNILTICIKDDQIIDGDSVSIEWNDSMVLQNVALTSELECVKIVLEEGRSNYLVIHALNEGSRKPNTSRIILFEGDKQKERTIHCDLKSSSAIKLTYNNHK